MTDERATISVPKSWWTELLRSPMLKVVAAGGAMTFLPGTGYEIVNSVTGKNEQRIIEMTLATQTAINLILEGQKDELGPGVRADIRDECTAAILEYAQLGPIRPVPPNPPPPAD